MRVITLIERGKPKLAPESNVYVFAVTSITGWLPRYEVTYALAVLFCSAALIRSANSLLRAPTGSPTRLVATSVSPSSWNVMLEPMGEIGRAHV